MKKQNLHFFETLPEWYWKSGIHDARIEKAEAFEFTIDYSKKGKEKQYRNMLSLKIDASKALFDSEVKEIRFYNYSIISKEISPKSLENVWWLSDSLSEENGKFVLKIETTEDIIFKLKFEIAEVGRAYENK